MSHNPFTNRAHEVARDCLALGDVVPIYAFHGCHGSMRFGVCEACEEICFLWPSKLTAGFICEKCEHEICSELDARDDERRAWDEEHRGSECSPACGYCGACS